MKSLVLAEKPSVARDIARVLGCHKNISGAIEGSNYIVTWALGHLVTLADPEEYDKKFKAWDMSYLPMVPKKWELVVIKQTSKQYHNVKTQLFRKDVSEIIIATDAGREGELVARWILDKSGCHKPIRRLWISSVTDKAIKEGFAHLKDGRAYNDLYHAARSRAEADWLVGINATRALTCKYNAQLSCGRVQTPTLALIVKREQEIESFVSKPFWEIIATFEMDGHKYEGKWEKDGESRLDQKEMAEKIAAFCQSKEAVIKDMKTERKEFQPPLLFNLSSLQATANKAFKYSPKKTLDILQKLYQKGIVSYPRSDSNYVTEGEAELFPDILEKLGQFEDYKSLMPVPNPSIIHNKRFVNEKKVSDHYAIIPTEQVTNPSRLSGEERNIYDLIVRRLIAAHYESAVFDYTTITTLVDGRAEFISKGKQQIREGWRQVVFLDDKDEDTILPNVKKDDTGIVKKVKVKEGKTQPPKRYTEGQLITLMKTAGKHLDNEELEKVLMKSEGLGTEATRAGIITSLKDRKYIDVKKNQVFATDKGKVLIKAIGEEILASPEMTAKWEQRLAEIGEGKASAAQFMEQTKKLTAKIIEDAIKGFETWDFSDYNVESIQRKGSKFPKPKKMGQCPLCQGDVVDKGQFYGCSNYREKECKFTFSKTILGKKISQANMQKLLKEGRTNLIKGFSKGENTFDATLEWKDGKINFLFSTENVGKS